MFSYADRESVCCLMALSSSLFVEVISFIIVYHFLGARISNRMDLEGGVNCTNLLNVFLEIVNPSTLENFTLPDGSLLLPTKLSMGESEQLPTNS